ncbi:MAG: hypothetical protein VXZ82_19130 [Planctomycetota bacterium]|nr:hypothetical protein [Planctomycetota bacterium]
MTFDLSIGIDYSGRQTASTRTPALQIYAGFDDAEPRRIVSPESSPKTFRNWNRKEIAGWIIDQAQQGLRFIAGVDHGFSFPLDYFQRYKLSSWDHYLADFCEHWPTDQEQTPVDSIRDEINGPLKRVGSSKDLRLTEKWTSSAKSVFLFDVQGSVAKSTHAGLPWLRRIRDTVGSQVHFWPFDGWQPAEGKSVIAEVFPSIFRNRYPKDTRTADQQDAYCVARWLSEAQQSGVLDHYFEPPLTAKEREVADLEGWILGIC